HWEQVYTTKATTEVSWFQAHARMSLKLIQAAGTPASAAILDVGGGASVLVEDLLAQGFADLTVLDISGAALAAARARMGAQAARVKWIEASILEAGLPAEAFDVWHDRAVFHFLTAAEDRQAYVRQLARALKPGGLVLLATFAEDGPAKCSGLPVVRYGAEGLQAELGAAFTLLGQEREAHQTPFGTEQKFIYCTFRKA
ncbi:MAG TPA: class I SAM-dependent methyltransferase, partial [Holophagaceae bacterium]|nr:class I SAM-dependent methyltransferase [Holophagaceae bacterium]